jgi:hypothetical protein
VIVVAGVKLSAMIVAASVKVSTCEGNVLVKQFPLVVVTLNLIACLVNQEYY